MILALHRPPFATLLLTLWLLFWPQVHAESWRFAAIGDTPYSEYERQELPKMMAEIAAENVDFLVHVGDFKLARTPCSDALFVDRRKLFDASPVPFIYVPGDNEWTDCRQVLAGGFDPVERLEKLRSLFFAEEQSLGARKLSVQRQSSRYPEHLRWRLGPVLFLTLNVPGPNNHFGSGMTPGIEFLERNARVLDWLRDGFASARREGAPAIVIIMQASPDFKAYASGLGNSGYRQLLDTLRSETLSFAGRVLLVHGDTHWQRLDHPLRHPATGQPLANFTRIETFGSPFLGWVKVIIDLDHPRLFRFEVRPYERPPGTVGSAPGFKATLLARLRAKGEQHR